METTPEQILQQVKQLIEEKKYQEIITLLNDKLLRDYNDPSLYAWLARVYLSLNNLELSLNYAQRSVEIDPQSSTGYIIRGITRYERKEYDKAIADYDEAIRLDPSFARTYSNRGVTWSDMKEYDKAFADYDEAIRLDPNYTIAYNNRGNFWFNKKEYDKAIVDYDKAIQIDSKYASAYNNRGNVWSRKKKYDKAIADYDKAIQIESDYADYYFNRGIVLSRLKDIDKAIFNYSEAIRLNSNYEKAYMNRGYLWSNKKEYAKAIMDFERFVELTNNPDDYYQQVALSEIEELKLKIENAWYDEIDTIIDDIKQLLLFDKPCLTHYTSLSGAQAMILDNSVFRLSEGAFLNDTSEGRELFNYLSFEMTKRNTDETLAELFVERPFIGSFVADNKHNDLTLWRMYGKEAQAEARGCALTIYKNDFIDNIKNKITPIDPKSSVQPQNEEQFTFYNVAYLSKDKFIVPGKSDLVSSQLNELMNNLRDKATMITEEQKISVTKPLNDIAYLIKSSEYQYENEVRLVVQGVGFAKVIDKKFTPPRVYIELVDIVPTLQKITLGPKVDRADEWAAAFNYHIKAQLKDSKEKIDIIISHLPFK